MQNSVAFVLTLCLVGCGSSGAVRDAPANGSAGTSPYAGRSSSVVPSLTTQEVEDLLAGRGLGLARAAELNGYPGPRHVLDLQSELELDAETVASAEQLFREMQAAAQPLGARVVELEKELGELFSSRSVEEEMLAQKVDALATLMGQLRTIHLRAHIEMASLLTSEQRAEYQRLRGYASSAPEPAPAGEHSGHHAQ